MPFGLYIHVPFCSRRCPYCDFAFVVRKNPPTERYTRSVIREIAASGLPPADTIYFGGGTPSLLSAEQVSSILAAIPRTPACNVTFEANPDDRAKFAAFAAAGIHRLSIGVQALADAHLSTLGRTHSADDAREAVREAVRIFGDVNADLIFGVPGQSTAELLAAAGELLTLGVNHISAYGLTVHEGTLLAKAAHSGTFLPVSEGAEREQFLALDAYLRERGFEHYEISNYARPGHRSRHNEIYWTGASYRGVGPAAHSFDAGAGRRFWNLRSLDKWLEKIESDSSPLEGEEFLDAEARRTERLYLGLRRSEGLPREALGGDPATESKIRAALTQGLLQETAGRISLTPEGMAVADTIVEGLLAVPNG